ncbi:ABC-F family ATP-binding cassette domain-containing protein [Rhodovibrio salinarum]|uniref:ABC transporter n=1 Tax=Rhodovibrio salinarum TaxID=1087 RepID=A0A934QKT3_9PROT|nr:ABC-F family ATP-binding cassette domain-containing protein [Rhodovibrio salinarum]MBK1698767.1 ABC transporter [Rhodovibrio salinarum]
MPASVTLCNLSWSAPDGTAVLSDLNFSFAAERTGLVGRNGSGKTTLLRLITGDLAPSTGNVTRTGTAGLLRQSLLPEASDTVADLFFEVSSALELINRAEVGRASVEELAEADWTLPARMERALHRCGLAVDPQAPLLGLSGGQRTRARLAALLFAEPDVLMLDEPTNDLDRAGRVAVIDILRDWRQAAIVVSHDRELLEEMDAIVELSNLGARRYDGGYSAYHTQKQEKLAAVRQDLADAEKARAEQKRRAQQAAERKARKDSRGRRSRTKGDQPKVLMDARKERAEGSDGTHARLRNDRRVAAEAKVSEAREKVEVVEPLTMEIAPTGLPRSRTVLRLEGVSGGPDPDRPIIRNRSLVMTGPERIAVTGPNGSGKTTLLNLVAGRRAPDAGTIRREVATAYLDQDVGFLVPELSLRESFCRLNPEANETECRAALARFRFRSDEALRLINSLSGGERLRAGLACTIGRSEPPALLILDEPTNHLDLDGIEALEAALTSYDGALLLVSHDEAFLDRLRIDRRVSLGEQPGSFVSLGRT